MRWSYRIYLVEETNGMEHEMIISNIISIRDKWNGTWDNHMIISNIISSRRDKWNGTWDDHIEYN